MRRMPGRLVGATVDGEGRRGYVLTLQAREQHIRREHATSNITTNHALMALAATVYLAHMGGDGLRRLAELSTERAHALASQIQAHKGYRLQFDGPFLWEFVVRTPYPAEQTQGLMLERGVLPGLPLGRELEALEHALPGITVTRSRQRDAKVVCRCGVVGLELQCRFEELNRFLVQLLPLVHESKVDLRPDIVGWRRAQSY